ncbi:MAG: DsbE family thiol:disulfide interchange protein [Gammaproteobacteria bacterium]|nr:DsbE family thiol:disulfide interchange protein [Gammaproteobacteria bacterium]
MKRTGLFIPLGVFLLIVVVGFAGFSLTDPHKLPSALLGKAFPDFTVPLLGDSATHVDRSALLGRPVLVNVWATWCPTCKAEHDELMRITSVSDLRIVGINYKDNARLALKWLADYGDPYDFTMQDLDGSLGVELGVYGAPESFLLNAEGRIVYKRVGEINRRIWEQEIAPRLAVLMDNESVRSGG